MKVNILTQVLRKQKYKSNFQIERMSDIDKDNERHLYAKDVVGFFIFLVVIFVFFMAATYG